MTWRRQREGQGSIAGSKHRNHSLQREFKRRNSRRAQLLQLLPYRHGWPARPQSLRSHTTHFQTKLATYLRLARQGVYQNAHETGAAEISGGISACWLISDPVGSHLENSGLRRRLPWRSRCSSVSVLPHTLTACFAEPDVLPPAAPVYLCYWCCSFKSSY